MEYLPHLRKSLTQPLIQDGQDGIRSVINQLDEYDLRREDYDNILEVTQWSDASNPMKDIETKVCM